MSVWWDWKGVIFFELLPRNQTINSDVYYRQLNKLNAAVKEKRPELVNLKGVIMKLPERWQKVFEQNGQYIID